jgi:hypothetical protein
LPRIAHAGARAITGQPCFEARFHCVQFDHWRVPFRAHTDPANTTLLRHFGD